LIETGVFSTDFGAFSMETKLFSIVSGTFST
jgi:hypothetical protein